MGKRIFPFFIKDVNLGVAEPCISIGELGTTCNQYRCWFDKIK